MGAGGGGGRWEGRDDAISLAFGKGLRRLARNTRLERDSIRSLRISGLFHGDKLTDPPIVCEDGIPRGGD